MISVYTKRNADGTFNVSVVNHEFVQMPDGNIWEQKGWERMNVDGVSLYGWTNSDLKQDAVAYLQGGELILYSQTRQRSKRKDDGIKAELIPR
jgi:hypothetical protein